MKDAETFKNRFFMSSKRSALLKGLEYRFKFTFSPLLRERLLTRRGRFATTLKGNLPKIVKVLVGSITEDCDICGSKDDLYIDSGIICGECRRGLKCFGDNPSILQAAMEYTILSK
jgi:hypothetical protein